MKNKTTCRGCGDDILQSEGIITNLKGAYHSDLPGCKQLARAEAPVWPED